MEYMTMIDNVLGMSLNIAGGGLDKLISMENVDIYGETDAEDCPSKSCFCKDKFGFMLATAIGGAKPLHPTMKTLLPIHKIKSNASWGGRVEMYRVNFHNFLAETDCGARQSVFGRNPTAADYTPLHEFDQSRFTDVEDAAMAWFEPSPMKWAVIDDCGEWPCSGPENIMLKFEKT